MLISVFTGLAAGIIHVLGGADHLVAMSPTAIRHPKLAFRHGILWGFGHSAGVLILALIAILIKDLAHIERMSTFAELSVGFALLIVGGLAIKTSLGLDVHVHKHDHHPDGLRHEHIHLHYLGANNHKNHSHASTSLGVLHGLAGASHLLAFMPALALPPLEAVVYVLAYLLGSIATMSIFLMLISFATMKTGFRSLPTLMGSAGVISLITGLFWLQRTSIQII